MFAIYSDGYFPKISLVGGICGQLMAFDQQRDDGRAGP
jgi:hypothetical protein